MKFSVPNSWDKTFEHDGLLYFAQRLEEMLFHYSIDLYKAPILNTNQLIKEYLETYKKVEQGKVKEENLEAILEEFKASFKNDVVLKKYWGQQNIDRVLSTINTSTRIDQGKLMDYLKHIFGPSRYYHWCTDYLKFIVPQQNQKKKIEQALRCFLPELICRGYTSEYIYAFTQNIFFKHRVESISSLSTFLEHFTFRDKNYRVYFGVFNTLLAFKDILAKRLHVNFDDDNNFKRLKLPNNHITIYFDIEAFDYYSAIKIAYTKLNIFLKFYKFVSHKNISLIYKTGMVSEIGNNTFSFLPAIPLGYNSIEDLDLSTAGDYTEVLVTSLLANARKEFQTIQKAVDLHNAALKGRNLESGFLNLWSVIEVLCVSNQSKSKIAEVIKILTPLLQKDYLASVFTDLQKKLADALTIEDYSTLIKSISQEFLDVGKIACFVLLPEYEQLRNTYYSKLSEFPVIRSRISEVSDIGKSKKKLFQMTEKYKERITWHIRRMYRVRNGIIHSGEIPNNIKALGEHLHSYVDCLLNEIIMKLSIQRELSSIENVFIDTNFTIQRFYEDFKEDGNFDEESVKQMLNPSLINIMKNEEKD